MNFSTDLYIKCVCKKCKAVQYYWSEPSKLDCPVCKQKMNKHVCCNIKKESYVKSNDYR